MNYDLKIFTENIEPEAINQIYELIKLAPFENAKVRIMPDVHFAYKPMDEIVSLISSTVDIVKVIKPVYNFKAGK